MQQLLVPVDCLLPLFFAFLDLLLKDRDVRPVLFQDSLCLLGGHQDVTGGFFRVEVVRDVVVLEDVIDPEVERLPEGLVHRLLIILEDL